jgi:hypothetical protein
MVPSDAAPTFVVNVSDVEEDLRRLLAAYATQVSRERMGIPVLDYLLVGRRHAGHLAGFALGEAILSDDPVGLDDLAPFLSLLAR